MDAARTTQFAHLAAAETGLRTWADTNGVPLVHLEFVVPFSPTNFGVSVWLFYATDADVQRLDREGLSDGAQKEFLSHLSAAGYPEDWLPEVAFFIDSHENVERNFEGNYFYRLR